MAGTRLFIMVSFILPVVILIPFGFILTKIERSSLPMTTIEKLGHGEDFLNSKRSFHVNIQFIPLTRLNNFLEYQQEALKTLQSSLQKKSLLVQVNYQLLKENITMKEVIGNSNEEVDENLLRVTPLDMNSHDGTYNFFLLCSDDLSHKGWTMGKYRHGWLNWCSGSLDKPLNDLQDMLRNIILPDPSQLQAIAKVSLAYRLNFALVIENPQDESLDWDFPKIFQQYLLPFIEEISVLANITVESQILYYGHLAKTIKYNERDKKYFVSSDELQQFMSANDWISSSILADREQMITFLIYVAEKKHQPLHIYVEKEMIYTSGFEIPGWGGVALLPYKKNRQGSLIHLEEMKRPMQQIVSQLRHLFGAPCGRTFCQDALNNTKFLPCPIYGIAKWEMDALTRSWIYRHVDSSVQTLKSIGLLVNSMPHMNVLERIQTHVVSSLSFLSKVDKLVSDQKRSAMLSNYKDIMQASRSAIAMADEAYYDHTMVPQLYFPDEHIYAVYLPLLAPLLLPLVLGLKREFTRYKQKQKAKTE